MKQCFLPVDALKPRHLHPHRNMQFIRISSCVSSAWIKDERNCKCVRVVTSAANVLIMRKHHPWLLLRRLPSSCLPRSAEAYRRFPEVCSCSANQMFREPLPSSRLWQGIHVEGLRFQGGWGRSMQIQSDDGLIHWPTTHDRQPHS